MTLLAFLMSVGIMMPWMLIIIAPLLTFMIIPGLLLLAKGKAKKTIVPNLKISSANN